MMREHISTWAIWKIATDYQGSTDSVLIICPCEEIFDGENVILIFVCCLWMIREIIMTIKE